MIIGHQKILLYLNNLIKNKNVLRNYLFLGPESVGKSKIANLFIKAVLSEQSSDNTLQDIDGCSCSVCRSIENNICSDFILINKEKDEIGIDDIRELKKKLLFKPVSQYRIVLIEQAQNLTEEASNAILKILEDMAPPTFFIFLSTRLLKPTIISRLEVIKFHLLSDEEVAGFFEGDDINNNINCHSESRKAGRRILLNSERSFVAPLCGAPQDDKRETVNYKKEVQDEIQYLAAGRAGKLIDLISSPERLQSSINFFNKFVAMMKLSMKGKLVCIDDYLKNDGKTDVFLESWLKILTDYMVSDLTGQARIPNSLKEKLRHCEPSETLCPSVALSGGGRFGHLQNLNSKYKEVAKSLKQILVLKELDSRYNLNKKLLLEQLAIE